MRGNQPDLLMLLREEILAAVSRHVALDPDKVIVRMERGKDISTLEVDVELPNGLEPAAGGSELTGVSSPLPAGERLGTVVI